MSMKLQPPIKNFRWNINISQLFGVNAELYQSKFGIPAHNGLDCVVHYKEDGSFDSKRGYGTPVLAAHNGVVEKIGYDVPHKQRGNSIQVIDESGQFSTVYLHLSGFQCNIGDKVKEGQTIGLLGNSGYTIPRSTEANPFLGSHLHFSVIDHTIPNNEYGGFIDPTPLLYHEGDKLPIYFNRELFYGRSGDDVSFLQTLLKIEGFAEDYEPIAFYGYKTLRDVRKLQEKYKIEPTYGYTGTKTRSFLLKKYI